MSTEAEQKKPNYREMVEEVVDLVTLAAVIRKTMVDNGFTEAYAGEVASAFLWANLGLP